MIILTKSHILFLHSQLIQETSGSDGIRDEAFPYAAINAPFQSFDGEDVFPTVQHKDAHLGYGLVKKHAFTDGNKRIGAHAMLVFLALNGIELTYSQRELSDLFTAHFGFSGIFSGILNNQPYDGPQQSPFLSFPSPFQVAHSY